MPSKVKPRKARAAKKPAASKLVKKMAKPKAPRKPREFIKNKGLQEGKVRIEYSGQL